MLRWETRAGALPRQVAGFVDMKDIETEITKLISEGEFAIHAATSLDHAILSLEEGAGDCALAIATLKHHRDCMIVLQEKFTIVSR